MRISLIGSGNVATHLAAAFTNAGHKILQVWSRNKENANLLAYHIKAESIDQLKQLNQEVEIVIISVKDDAIADIVSQLNLQNTLLVHTSGSTSLDILHSASKNTGVFYPLQTFSKTKSVEFSRIPILIEGSTEKGIKVLRELAASVSAQVLEIDSQKRLALHVAAVFACNFSNYLFSVSNEILHGQGLDFDLLRPLIQETADKIMSGDPKGMQTGPGVRNDQQIIQKHLDFLKDTPGLQTIYKLLSQGIINFHHKP